VQTLVKNSEQQGKNPYSFKNILIKKIVYKQVH
jgi:hypothetical protein